MAQRTKQDAERVLKSYQSAYLYDRCLDQQLNDFDIPLLGFNAWFHSLSYEERQDYNEAYADLCRA